ncbi:hypothetical protein C0J08_06770 [Marinomonas sp. CT5]|uniref:hypothetical protein n=1 Tax=Marinomonas sp. CT5 TaxID=2066133 RepID=UPI001BB0914A|nr:hypothetical protein [Marinomonas sp. CT5]QUX98098.1 hypothetical protein C0J08_06770 [Marinomonas sp. CT5]
MKNENIISKFLIELVKDLESLSESDIKKLNSGEYSLALKVLKKNQSQEGKPELDTKKANLVLDELKACNSRDSGYEILNNNFKNKNELEWFAKQIDIFVMKQDKVDKIREKIIEGTVGATLRSSAIQRNDT